MWKDLRPLRSNLDDELDDPNSSGIGAVEQYWASDEQRTEAIDRLGTMMLSAVEAERPSHIWRWTLVLILLGVVAGGVIAWATRKPPVLADAQPYATGVAAQPTAKKQYAWAMSLARCAPADEQQKAWQSVLEHFPEDAAYVPLAKLQLAWLALRQEQNDLALKYFGEISESSDSDAKLRSVATAGEFIVLALEKDAGATERLSDFSAELGELSPASLAKFSKTVDQTLADRQMIRLLAMLIRRQQQSINSDAAKQWDRFLEERFPDESTESDDG